MDTQANFTWCKIHHPSGGPRVAGGAREHQRAADFFIAVILPVAARVIYMLRVIFIFAQFVPGSAGLGLGLTRI